MANRFKGDVPFGPDHTLRFGTYAWGLLERELEMPMGKIGDRLALMAEKGAGTKKIELRFVTAIIWAGLQKHHPEMALSDACDLIDDMGLDGTLAALSDGFEASTASAEGNVPPPPKPLGRKPRKG